MLHTVKKYLKFCLAVACVLSCQPDAHAEYILKNGQLVEVEQIARHSPEEHYNKAVKAWHANDIKEAVKQFRILTTNFPTHHLTGEAYYYLGAGYYYLEEYDFANQELDYYLQVNCSPEYLEEVMHLKLCIADAFRCGAKKRLWGSRRCPKWLNGEDLALEIYDEVISTLPCHEIAVRALFSKGTLLCQQRDFYCAVETFQMLIRRFPDQNDAAEAYLAIIRTYHRQAWFEYQNPDILPLAEIAFRHFQEDFPNEDRLADAQEELLEIKEIYAQGLYETGLFFERTCHPQAATLYYLSAITSYPETCIAESAKQRLDYLLRCYPCLDLPECRCQISSEDFELPSIDVDANSEYFQCEG